MNEWPEHETSGQIRVDHYRMEARTARRPLSSLHDGRMRSARVLHAVSCCGGAPTKSRAIVLVAV